MYANDTAIIIRSQEGADHISQILEEYAQPPDHESMGEIVPTPCYVAIRLTLIVQYITPDNPCIHLGIPLGVDIENQLKNHWDIIFYRNSKSYLNHWLVG